MHKAIYKKYSKIDDIEWVNILFKSVETQIIEGISFPGFPDENIQIGTVGSSGKQSLIEPKHMYLEIKRISKITNKSIFNKKIFGKTKLLDFACGYGRMIKFFMKDIHPGKLYGSDVRKESIDLCRSLFYSKNSISDKHDSIIFDINNPFPPTKYKKIILILLWLIHYFRIYLKMPI